MPSWIYAVLIGGGLAALNIWLFLMNKKTPVPKGCENLKPDCKGCAIADCLTRQKFEAEEKERKTASC